MELFDNLELDFRLKLRIKEFFYYCRQDVFQLGAVRCNNLIRFYDNFSSCDSRSKVLFLERETVKYFIELLEEDYKVKEDFSEVFQEIEKEVNEICKANKSMLENTYNMDAVTDKNKINIQLPEFCNNSYLATGINNRNTATVVGLGTLSNRDSMELAKAIDYFHKQIQESFQVSYNNINGEKENG